MTHHSFVPLSRSQEPPGRCKRRAKASSDRASDDKPSDKAIVKALGHDGRKMMALMIRKIPFSDTPLVIEPATAGRKCHT